MDNNQENNNQGNKNGPNKFNINSYWIYGLIILGILQMPPFIGFLSSLLIVMAGLGSLVTAHHRAAPETAIVQTELDL